MAEDILQDGLFEAPWDAPHFRRLPGMCPVGPDDWLTVDEAHAAQMALRDRLIAERRAAVVALLPGAEAVADEMLVLALDTLARRFDHAVTPDTVRRPDGVTVPVDRADPMGTLGRLVQADVCLLDKRGAEHVLVGAVLAFPSGWTLAQKIGRPMGRIHRPVDAYEPNVAARVERLLEGLRPGRPLMRANLLWHRDPTLHAPRLEGAPRPAGTGDRDYLRSERQCLLRLPQTGAVAFTIHTVVVDAGTLPPEMRAVLKRRPD